MDPDVALTAIRELVKEHDRAELDASDRDRLTDVIAALDKWISRGGFLPKEWRKTP